LEIRPIIQQDFLEFQDDITLSGMIGKLKQFEKRSGLVFRNKKYLGLVGKKKLLRSNIDSTEMKIDKLVEKTPILNENADVIETAYLMFQSNTDFLPVEKDKKIIGVLTGVDLAALACTIPELSGLKVSDTKLEKPSSVHRDECISSAISIMYQEQLDNVPVFDEGKLYGILSYRDLLRKYLNWSPKRDVSGKFNSVVKTKIARVDNFAFGDLSVESFSTNDNLIKVQKNDKLNQAVELMKEKRISDVLVMQGDEYVGVLTVKNVLRQISNLKVPQKFNISFVGLNEVGLGEDEIDLLKEIVSNEASKLQRNIKNEFHLTVHLKVYEKDGNKQKYSINMRIEGIGKILSVTQDDWDWIVALRKTFENARNNLKKQLKN
jgi:acetoin utilization protein AcuB